MANKQLKKRGDRTRARKNPSAVPPGIYQAKFNPELRTFVLDSISSVGEYFANKVDCGKVVVMKKNEKGEWEK